MKLLCFAALVFALLPEIPGCEDDKNYNPSPITPIPRPEGELPPPQDDGPPIPKPIPPRPPPSEGADAGSVVAEAPPTPPPPPKKEEPPPKKSPNWEARVTGGACDGHVVASAHGMKADATARFGPKEASDKSSPSKKEADAFWARLDGEKWWTLENEPGGVVSVRLGQFSRAFNENSSERGDRVAAAIRKLAGCDDAAVKAKKAPDPKKKKKGK